MVIPPPVERREPELLQSPTAVERRSGLTPVTLFATLVVAYVVFKAQLVVFLTLLAIIFATVIEGPLRRLERQRIPRGVGILMIYGMIIGTLVLLGILIAPSISDQVDTFRQEAPEQLRELRAEWRLSGNPVLRGAGYDLLGRVITAIEAPPAPPQSTSFDLVLSIGGGIVAALAVLAMAFYYLMEKALLRRLVLQELRPEARTRVSRIWDEAEAKVGDWLRGQLTLCLIIGVTATIGYGIMGVRFWPLLGLWAGITEIIPIIGPWLGGIPAVLIAFTISWQTALLVTGFIVLLQLTENTILVPRVMKGAVGLTPLTVFIAILAGTQFYGPLGAILAIPVAALIQILLTEYLDARRGAYRPTTLSLPGWRWMRGPIAADAGESAPPVPVDPAELSRAAQAEAAGFPAPPPGDSPGSPAAQPVDYTPASPFGARGWTSDLLARAAGSLTGSRSENAPPANRPPDEGK
jgi:predicted PurR-regulated permease PerM